MPARINTKFIFALSSVLILLVLGLVGFWYVFVNRSADAYIRRAEYELSQGEFAAAVSQYERAIVKRPRDLNLLDQYLNTLQRLEAPNIVKARQYLGKTQEATRMAADLASHDPQRLEDYYQLLDRYYRDLGSAGFNTRLYDQANLRLDAYPDNLTARKWRGIAQVRRLRSDMTQADRQQAHDDLTLVLEQEPDNAQVLHYLAMWNLFEANRVDPPGDNPGDQPQRGQELRELALQQSNQMFALKPDDARFQLLRLEVLLHAQFIQDDRFVYLDEALPTVNALEQALLENPQPFYRVLPVARLLQAADRERIASEDSQTARTPTQGQLRAELLLRAAAQAAPQDVVYLYELGMLQKTIGQTDAALATLLAARELDATGHAIDMLRSADTRLRASFEAANLMLIQAAGASSPEDAKALIAQVKVVADEIQTAAGESVMVDILRGKMLLSENNLRAGLQRIDRASSQLQDRNPELLMISAQARRKLGENGAAITRYKQLFELLPQNTAIQIELAKAYLQTRQASEAAKLIDQTLEQDPGNPDALRLQAAMLAGSPTRADDAIAAFEALGARDDPDQQLALGRLYARAGRQEEAVKLIAQAFENNPANLNALQALLKLTAEPKAQLALIQQAREARPDDNAGLDVLERHVQWLAENPQLSEDQQQVRAERARMIQEAVQARIDAEDDPFKKAMAEARFHLGLEEDQQVMDALARAQAIDANNPQLVDLQFDLALRDEDWSAAEKRVEQAAQLDLDQAKGDFYRGRLETARQRYPLAIAAYRRALSSAPAHSQGWMLYGNVLAQNEEYDAAADALEQSIGQRPDNVTALRTLAMVELKRDQGTRALKWIREALKFAPNDRTLLNQYLALEGEYGNVEQAIALREQLAQADPTDLANRRALVGLQARAGRADQALALAQTMANENPDDLASTAGLASAHRLAGDIASGQRVLEQFIAQRGSNVTVADRLMLARYLIQTNLEEGVAAYQSARAMEDPQKREVSRELGDVLFARGVSEPAAKIYSELHDADPEDQGVSLRLAETLIRLQRFEEAKKILVGLDQGNADIEVLLAMIASEQGQNDEALRKFNAAIKRDPRRAELYRQRAALLATDSDHVADAQRDLNTALELNPNLTDARLMLAQLYFQRNDFADGQRELRNLLNRNPEHIQARVQLINLLAQRGERSAARLLIQEGQAMFPDQPTWPALAGQLAMQGGDYAQAVAAWHEVVRLEPSARNVGGLAVAMFKAGASDQVLPMLAEHVTVVNDEPLLQALRGRALVAEGQSQAGQQVLVHAMQRAKTYTQFTSVVAQLRQVYSSKQSAAMLMSAQEPERSAWYQLALAKLDIEQDQFSQAIARLEALRSTVTDVQQLGSIDQLLALSFQSNAQDQQAAQVYRRILKASPDNFNALNNLAYMLGESDDPALLAEALGLAQRAVDQAPNNPWVLDTLGWVQLRQGDDLDAARRTLEQSLKIKPLPANCLHLGQVYAQSNRPARALDMYRQALELAGVEKDVDMMQKAQAAIDLLSQEEK